MKSRVPRPGSLRTSAFAGFRFPPEVIVVAVRWYLRYNLSYRDVQELLVERAVEGDHVTVFRWVQRFTPLLADAARFARHAPGDRWFVDETYVKCKTSPTESRFRCQRNPAPVREADHPYGWHHQLLAALVHLATTPPATDPDQPLRR